MVDNSADNKSIRWDNAHLIQECVKDFLAVSLGDKVASKVNISVTPVEFMHNVFNAHITNELELTPSGRCAFSKAVLTATEYYAREIHPNAIVNFN